MITLIDGVTISVAPPAVPSALVAPPSSASVTTVPDLTYAVTIEALFPAVSTAPPVSAPTVLVPVAGPAGARGIDGAPGGSYYLYTQGTPAATWIITHNFGRLAQVTVFDSSNDVIYTDVVQGTPDQATVIFAVPTAGSAVVS